jgi:hypothetical protein
MEANHLPVAVNRLTKDLDLKVLRWAFSRKIVSTHEELTQIQLQKINYFAGYLFPLSSSKDLEWIMKCFLWLFILDDVQEKIAEGEFQAVIQALRPESKEENSFLDNPMVVTWFELKSELSARFDSDWLSEWNVHWQDFLSGQLWEKGNKTAGRIPHLTDYQLNRLYVSGVYLSFQLLKAENQPQPSCQSELLEYKIARWICLSNDLISADKEIQSKDVHNELIIIAHLSGGDLPSTKKYLERKKDRLKDEIEKLSLELSNSASECHAWLEGLKLLMGGCAFWSNEVTLRYGSYLNGVSHT